MSPAKTKKVWWKRSAEELKGLPDAELEYCAGSVLTDQELLGLSEADHVVLHAASLVVQQEASERSRARAEAEREANRTPPWEPTKAKRLTVVGVDGRTDVVTVDPWHGGFLVIESDEPQPDAPWVVEKVVRRFGLTGVQSLVLEDVEES
jgi:hypothetical protein